MIEPAMTNTNLADLIDRWQPLTVLVLGDVMLDSYLVGHSDRLCQEAPVPIVAVHQRRDYPGGAANTAANVASLGADVFLLSAIGCDPEGERLQQVLTESKISCEHLIVSDDRRTLTKQRVVAEQHLIVRFDHGSTEPLTPALEQQLIDRLIQLFPCCDAVIISDYQYGVLTPRVIQLLAILQAQLPRTIVVDAKQLATYKAVNATAIKPNYFEAIQILGLPKQTRDRADQIAPYGDQLLQLTGAKIAAVTLDAEGAIVFEQGQPAFRTTAQPAPQQQTSGAGDTFIATLALALANHTPTHTTAFLAAAATAVVVQQPGTIQCTATALCQLLKGQDKQICDRSELATWVQYYRRLNRRIVFTNGCFDILHSGHISYLTQAKALGDVLIIGVNSDESVQQLKGCDRPINALGERLTMLSALSCVDHVVPFSELTPHQLIQVISPDIFVKGGDYTKDTLPEATLVEALGGTVQLLPYVPDRSTTHLIHQIRMLNHSSPI
jgi:D-beta-D-heptose 7-phosphate kinase/D-beta-D-heptose 1-phosphate adenosyltransferase